MPGRFSRQVEFLTSLSIGKGALKLPSHVESMTLTFKKLNSYGHMGARKFWRLYLPKIQFHNPNLPISVIRTEATTEVEHKAAPSTLTISFKDRAPVVLDVKNKHSDSILRDFVSATSGEPVKDTTPLLGKPDMRIKLNP
ncbi:hypothetical protein V1520DRAFT_331726 [Lipomyces starkeyi]|uniref:Ribosomal protein/NADH dehydrogenase domain-containing protein n=1 Tax=Lipomyces starkeyi NRRL Y-11557 TaxID=675824 RepID=A0A1E3Q7R9_LIPST|nr:hypothetical protein LIPSTDRAFT_2969 [Lipomyces starkeyi NRRL Y-11557]